MPIYEYTCSECGRIFEKMVRFSEADQSPECPECKSPKTEKKISIVGSFGTSLSGNASSSGSGCGSRGGFS